MKTPLVSIILSTYNGSKYITDSIKSVLKQTFSNFELIIINDCSTDNVEQIILDFKKIDNRIVYIKNGTNLKLTASLNKGLKLAKGKYIARIDDDDLWMQKKLEKQIKFMETNPDYGLCGTSYQIFDENNETKEIKIQTNNDLIKKVFLRQNKFCHSSVIFKKEINNDLVKYNKKRNLVEDYELWLRIGIKSKLFILPDILTKYRLNNGLSINNRLKQLKLGIQMIKKFRGNYENFYTSFIFKKILYISIYIALKLNIYKQISYFYRKIF